MTEDYGEHPAAWKATTHCTVCGQTEDACRRNPYGGHEYVGAATHQVQLNRERRQHLAARHGTGEGDR
ncbi:hypothetical protein [Nocardioides sambongensis]|uniref:hypothetical protein n=1 Tax=Nocardioides sambongensis TaxID=2589074 RepID=UPI00112EB8AB|nr:hypothetical protein [Nocardioides sambongensis]